MKAFTLRINEANLQQLKLLKVFGKIKSVQSAINQAIDEFLRKREK
ncbi:MAG: hypothetical protein ABII23_03120 [bacterium]